MWFLKLFNLKIGKNGGDASTSPNGTNPYDKNNNKDDDFGEDDGFDDDDITSEAYLERRRELCDGLPSGKHDSKELADIFYKLLKEKKDTNQLMDVNVQKELVKEAERLEIKDKATLVLTELLLTKENILSDIKQYRVLLMMKRMPTPITTVMVTAKIQMRTKKMTMTKKRSIANHLKQRPRQA